MIGNYTHGGDVFAWNGDILDYSISLNPMGMPPCAIEAGQRAMADVPRYPDPFCRALTQAISRRDGVDQGMILCGNGASDLIDRIIRAARPKEALIPEPTFLEYKRLLKVNGCKVKTHYMDKERSFAMTEDVLTEITEKTDIVFLCTPNNPSGLLLETELLRKILLRCRQVGAVLVLDQCFLELCSRPYDDFKSELPGGNLILLRALTKNFAMAPLRVGYCLCADEALMGRMAELGQPWAVSVPAQKAGAAALSCASDWPEKCLEWLPAERERISAAFRRAGALVYPSDSNFILLKWKDSRLKERLLEYKIMIRQCSDFDGLGPEYFRASVRTREENDHLIATLERLGE